ncbi:nuclear localization sequence binding protein [Neophaeococcomyces mojaviensis]|uniref:Nuclear localization sequence binding protein n=1 Tax=Neophaeococcomyces mojaviensis TaxID=3383035 RepID=A0ACC3A9H2_9EURO|nr:nuclear localization sequence binding protein [Knufia sp. JES_112]
MSKTKSATKATKPSKDTLTKVKDAGVTKPAQTTKAKSKEVAKQVAAKEEKKEKKSKKSKKEPTPEPESESESESSESESEVEVKKSSANGKTNGVKKTAAKEESSDESESSGSDSDEEEAPAPKKVADKKVNGAKAPAKRDQSSDESGSESSDDDDETPAAVLGTAPPVDKAKEESSEDDSDASSDEEEAAKPKTKSAKAETSDDSEDDDDSDDSESEEEAKLEKPAAKVNKRKAEEEAEPITKKAKTDDAETGKSKNLFVGNLSWNIDEDWLRSTFEEHGELTGARVMTDRATGRSKGFGYVEFANAEDASAAYEAKKGFELDGRELNVDYASVKPDNKDKLDNRRKSYGDQLSEPSSTLFVGNLSFDVGQEQVTEAFTPYGTVKGIRLPTDRETGQPKGYGYVEFDTADDAKAALEAMQGGYIGNRPVRLDYSTGRPQNNDSNGGRGGRGGFGGGFGGRGRGGDRGRGGRGGFGGRGGGRGAPRGGRGGSTNRGGFGDFSGTKKSFD